MAIRVSFLFVFPVTVFVAFTGCHLAQEKRKEKYYYNHVFYRLPVTENQHRIPLRKPFLPSGGNEASREEWNLCGIYSFYEGEYLYSEYCFLKALRLSSFQDEPPPGKLNDDLRVFLNILFLYELAPDDDIQEKKKRFIKELLTLLQNREDVLIEAVKETRKKNVGNLDVEIAYTYLQSQKQPSENFIYEYVTTLLIKQRYTYNREYLQNIKNPSLQKNLLDDTGWYFYRKRMYGEYIKVYTDFKDILDKNKLIPESSYYFENLFIAYYEAYKQNTVKTFPEDLYKAVLDAKVLREDTYRSFLAFFFEEKLLHAGKAELDTVFRKDFRFSCDLPSLFCSPQYRIRKAKYLYETFGTADRVMLEKGRTLFLLPRTDR